MKKPMFYAFTGLLMCLLSAAATCVADGNSSNISVIGLGIGTIRNLDGIWGKGVPELAPVYSFEMLELTPHPTFISGFSIEGFFGGGRNTTETSFGSIKRSCDAKGGSITFILGPYNPRHKGTIYVGVGPAILLTDLSRIGAFDTSGYDEYSFSRHYHSTVYGLSLKLGGYARLERSAMGIGLTFNGIIGQVTGEGSEKINEITFLFYAKLNILFFSEG